MSDAQPRLIVISQVMPFPRSAGQQQRVYYKLRALRETFDITFLSAVEPERMESMRAGLAPLVDDVILLPSHYTASALGRLWHKAAGEIYALRTGLKFSNYVVGQIELTAERIGAALGDRHFDAALFEYWHAVDTIAALHARGIKCVLDMHDVLWQSYARQLKDQSLPAWWKRRRVAQYRAREEAAWRQFDALIAINRAEMDTARQIVGPDTPIFYSPMGTDLDQWQYCYTPAQPPRIAYYGGLGSPHNAQDALRCCRDIMPRIWQAVPDAELWLVGSDPPGFLRQIAGRDPRVRLTGYVDQVQSVLSTMTVVLCPWTGTYGFRSRIVEVMGIGVPVVSTPDAVYGMDLIDGQGIFLDESDGGMAETALRLIREPDFAAAQSKLARQQAEQKYSYETSYVTLAHDMAAYVAQAR